MNLTFYGVAAGPRFNGIQSRFGYKLTEEDREAYIAAGLNRANELMAGQTDRHAAAVAAQIAEQMEQLAQIHQGMPGKVN